MAGLKDVLFVVYIRTSHLTKHSSILFKEFTTMFKITHIHKLIEDQYVFRSDFKVIKEVNDETKNNIYYIKDNLQNSIEKNIMGKTITKKIWLHGDELKELLTMNLM